MNRTLGCGGSDVAMICGLDKWRTPFQGYLEKIGEVENREPTDAMRYGIMIEPVIRQWYSDTTGRSVYVPQVLSHKDFDFILGSLDGITDDGRVLEIKTARSSVEWGEPGTDEIPIYYRLQVEQYMMITGLPIADVVVSFAGSMPVIYTVEADLELQELMIVKECEFWGMVLGREPPDPVTMTDFIQRFKVSTANEVTASEKAEKSVIELRSIKTLTKALSEDESALKAQIMAEMKDCDTLVDLTGNVLATWKTSKRGERRFLIKGENNE